MKSIRNSPHLVLAMLLIPGMSNAQAINKNSQITKHKEVIMSTMQRNKEVIGKLYEQSLNKRNLALLPDFIAEDYVGVRGVKGVAGFKEPIVGLINAFPDIHWKVEELFGEGDKVVVRWKWQGTHTGQFTNFTATGKTITNDGMAIYELKDGKIINVQLQTDRLGFLQQLEVLPADITVLSNKKASQGQVNFIDKFFVPAAAKAEFSERMRINRNIIKKLPGFIEDAAYEHTDEKGNLICITVAKWESKKAVEEAKEVVQAEYKKQGFNLAEMIQRLGITIDRAIYSEVESGKD